MKLLRFSLMLVAVLWLPARAADFSVMCNSMLEIAGRGCTIRLVGPIVAGDAERLRNVIREKLSDGWTYEVLLLDSPGGNVYEAMKIADVIRMALLETSTTRVTEKFDPSDLGLYRCASACFLVWVSGTKRQSFSGTSSLLGNYGLGLHRPFFSPETYKASPAKVAEAQQNMTTTVRDYLRREQVPERFIELMFERSSKEAYWLHESGHPAPIDGLAPWFEEMMIARCGYDPSYDRASEIRMVTIRNQGRDPKTDAAHRDYLAWRQRYNVCLSELRRRAQAAMR